jgi:hypothetical protein
LELYWLLERVEARRGSRLIPARVAHLPLMFAGAAQYLAGGVAWLAGW